MDHGENEWEGGRDESDESEDEDAFEGEDDEYSKGGLPSGHADASAPSQAGAGQDKG